MATIYDLIHDAANDVPDKTYVVVANQSYSYGEFKKSVEQIAAGLNKLGIQKGDKVALFLPNSIEFLYSMYALSRIGAVYVPANTALNTEELAYIVDHSESKALITHESLFPVAETLKEEIPSLENVICVGSVTADGIIPFENLATQDPVTFEDVSPNDIAAIMYTSGTTGKPKGVLLTHHAYVVTAEAYTDHVGWNADDKSICMLPLFHINAQAYSTLSTAWIKGTFVLLEQFSAGKFWDQVKEYGVTVFITMPTVSLILYNQPEKENDADNTVRQVVTALPLDIYEKFEARFGLDVITGYSLTENMMTFLNPLDHDLRKINSIGKPISPEMHRVKIVDSDDNEVPVGEMGEIAIQSPAVMKGYFKNEEETEKALKGGWLHTGDYGRMDEEGFVYFADRKKDIVRRGGENISSLEVEAVMNAHPKVALSAVIPVPDPILIEEVKAYIISGDQSLTYEEMAQYCEEKLAFYKRPRYFEFRADLPKTPTMRVKKNVLKSESDDLISGAYDAGKVKKKT